jgi:2'-5' RNA ligase
VPRARLGVVLLLPPPLDQEADGLRRAFGDPARGRIAPHLTLVAGVNVGHEDVPAALAVLRSAAARARPLRLGLGPVRAFPTDEHVAYLAVRDPEGAGEQGEVGGLDALARLRADVSRPPLRRPSEHDFVPHVTVAQGLEGERLAAVVDAGRSFSAEVSIDRVHLLQEQGTDGRRRWVPVADAALGPPVVVGRGGLPLELAPGELLDPEGAAMLGSGRPAGVPAAGAVAAGAVAAARDGEPLTRQPAVPAGTRPLVVVARREGAVVGVATGWTAGPAADLIRVVVAGVGHPDEVDPHLRRAWTSAAADRGASLAP